MGIGLRHRMVTTEEEIEKLAKRVVFLEGEVEAIKNSAIGLPLSDKWEWAITREYFILQPDEKKLILKDEGRGWCRAAALTSNRPDTELDFVLHQRIGTPKYAFAISADDLRTAGCIDPAGEAWVSVYDDINKIYISYYRPTGWLGLPYNLAFELSVWNKSIAAPVAGSVTLVAIVLRL